MHAGNADEEPSLSAGRQRDLFPFPPSSAVAPILPSRAQFRITDRRRRRLGHIFELATEIRVCLNEFGCMLG
eukprot:2184404-Lingulodinium_polyedra.AAC.1